MNNSKLFKSGFAIAMATASFSASAMTTEAGLDLCTRAMVDQLSNEAGTPLNFTMDSNAYPRSRMRRTETFHLDARAPGSDEIVGRYDCVVNNKAEVIELVMLPLSAEDASVRAWKTK